MIIVGIMWGYLSVSVRNVERYETRNIHARESHLLSSLKVTKNELNFLSEKT